MAKNQAPPPKDTPVEADYYDLKVDAVNRLVDAKNAPPVSNKEIKQYTSSKSKLNIPSWLKIVFVKFWFSGAICYFFLWGLGMYISGLDLMFAIAVGLGLCNDLMVNTLLHYFEPEKGAYDKWMMIPFRKFWTIFLNVIYSALILACIVWFYNFVNTLIVGAPAEDTPVVLPVEPVLFGLLYMGFDMLFIFFKNTMVKIIRDARAKAR